MNKRKLKITIPFFICWFAVLIFIIDGLGQFPKILNFFGGSLVLTEIFLWAVVIIPTVLVYCFTKGNKK